MQSTEDSGNFSTLDKEVGGNTTLIDVVSAILETETGPYMYVKQLYEYWQYEAYLFAMKYVSPLVFSMGIVGNTFAFIVLQSRSMRSSATSFL